MRHNQNSGQMQAELKAKPSNIRLTVTQASPQSLSLPPLSIAVVGLLKAGKSTLLNAMTGQEELFKSGVIRTTVKTST